jgi:hypothetical protein
MARFNDEIVQGRRGVIGSGEKGTPIRNTVRPDGNFDAILGGAGISQASQQETALRNAQETLGAGSGPNPRVGRGIQTPPQTQDTRFGSPRHQAGFGQNPGLGGVFNENAGGEITGPGVLSSFQEESAADEQARLAQGRQALDSINKAAEIRRGMFEQTRDDRLRRRLENLAFNTPANLDNIGSIKAARSTLEEMLGNEAGEGVDADTQIRLADLQRKITKDAADITDKEGKARLAEEKQASQQAFFDKTRLEELEVGSAATDEDKAQVRQEQLLRENARRNFTAADGSGGYDEAFEVGSEERALADALPALASSVSKAVEDQTGFVVLGQETPPIRTLKEALDLFQGVDSSFWQSSTFGFGSQNLEVQTEGGFLDINDIDFESIPQAARAVFLELSDPTSAVGRNVISKIYSPQEAQAFYARVRQQR